MSADLPTEGPRLAVVLPTHNPRADYLARAIAALRAQTRPLVTWELILIDNASTPAVQPTLVAWHPRGRIVREERLGLTAARLRGLEETNAEILVWVDDDNVLAPDYLDQVSRAFAQHARLGAAGGKALPEYETPPPSWYRPGLAPLGCRDFGETEIWMTWDNSARHRYPPHAPIGAGLAVRQEALQQWADAVRGDSRRLRFGRTGAALSSAEDNDINLTLLTHGWTLAYLPALRLQHLIPARRLTLDYQQQVARAAFRDYVRVLLLHGVSPWPAIAGWTLPLRKAKAWFTYGAWKSPAARIQWQGACGQFEGRVRSW